MSIDVWSVLLIAFASQCVFLTATFTIRPTDNKAARSLLIVLLTVILCINLSNLVESTYLYRKIPSVAGFARGMVFLLGPVLYLYALSIIKPDFKYKPSFLFHLLPYTIALVLIRVQLNSVPRQLYIASVDSLMEGKVKMNVTAMLWFVSYFIHLLVYMYLIRREMLNKPGGNYLIPLEERLAWIKSIGMAFGLVAIAFLGMVIYIGITGLYTITGNFIYSMVLAVMVYLIAFQAMAKGDLLSPDFATKYRSVKVSGHLEEAVFVKMQQLFGIEKIFTDPDLKISTVAQKLGMHPHVVSQIINERLNKTFSELLNDYRISEFKARVTNVKYAHYSIIGIAFDVGYRSKSAFNEAFKKQTGLTPSGYLKSASPNLVEKLS